MGKIAHGKRSASSENGEWSVKTPAMVMSQEATSTDQYHFSDWRMPQVTSHITGAA